MTVAEIEQLPLVGFEGDGAKVSRRAEASECLCLGRLGGSLESTVQRGPWGKQQDLGLVLELQNANTRKPRLPWEAVTECMSYGTRTSGVYPEVQQRGMARSFAAAGQRGSGGDRGKGEGGSR